MTFKQSLHSALEADLSRRRVDAADGFVGDGGQCDRADRWGELDDDRGVAVAIDVKRLGAQGLAAGGDEPQLIFLPRRRRSEIKDRDAPARMIAIPKHLSARLGIAGERDG